MTETDRPLGEFDRIERFFAPLSEGDAGSFALTDDAAMLPEPPAGSRWIVTTDALVGGVHFLPDDPPGLVARKALRVNLSDLAAMGARPTGYTLALALPKGLRDPELWLDGFASGLADDQHEFGVVLFGGDSVATPGPITISVTAFGSAPADRLIRRSGAQPGDDVWVSGTIGDAALGLQALSGRITDTDDHLIDRYRVPRPRTGLGERLIGLASAGLDVSDGLVQDAGHIAHASGVRLIIEAPRIPLSPSARDAVGTDPDLFLQVLEGGDDYELLFTAAPEDAERIGEACDAAAVPAHRIGRVEAGSGVAVVDRNGLPLDGLSGGWQHF